MQMKASDEVRRLVFAGALACVPLVAPCGPLQGDSGATVVPVRQFTVDGKPVRLAEDETRAYDYEVTAVLSKGVVSRIVSQKRVYSPKCYWPERYDTDDVVCVFGRQEIPDNHESVKFVVRPMNAWGKAGEPIESSPDAYWSKGPLYPF